MTPLVTVIMPVFNAASYVAEAIDSVINQTYTNWELIIINDGSTDDSDKIIKQFDDSRIRYFQKERGGVSEARNLGFLSMRGEYMCFLDSDDILPSNSIQSRLDVFLNGSKDLEFVDGKVRVESIVDGKLLREYTPSFTGKPFNELIKIKDNCFVGLTWMIKIDKTKIYKMRNQTHGEDLLFFLELSKIGGLYCYTSETVLRYRRRSDSAMTSIDKLNLGYIEICRQIQKWDDVSIFDKLVFWIKSRKIMFLSFLFDKGSVVDAIKSLFMR